MAAEDEAKKKAEEEAAAADAEKQRLAAEDDAKKKAEEEAAAADAEKQRLAAEDESKRKAEQEAAAAEAEKQRVASEEAAKKKAEDDARAAEEQRKADEREQAEADAEAQRLADEAAKAEEAKRVTDAAEDKRKDQELAEARRKDADDAKKKAEADHCQGLMRSAMAEGMINFDRAKADLARDSFLTLDRLAGIVKVCPNARIKIVGHTDSEGEVERNQGLSERRAKAVGDYLTSKGVDPSRLTTEGYGKSRPLVSNDTPEGMRQNRRIEFSVTPAP